MPALFVYAIAVVSIFCYAALPVISKKSLISGVPPFAFIGITMLLMSLTSISISLVTEKKFSLMQLKGPEWFGLILFTAVNLVGFFLLLTSVSKMPIAHYQIMGVVGPVVSIILAYFFLGEQIKPQFFLGIALVGAGLFVALK